LLPNPVPSKICSNAFHGTRNNKKNQYYKKLKRHAQRGFLESLVLDYAVWVFWAKKYFPSVSFWKYFLLFKLIKTVFLATNL